MLPLPVIEHLAGLETGGLPSTGVTYWTPCTRSFLKRLNSLSVGALSQSLPFRLNEQVMLYSWSLSWKASLAYRLPRPE